MVENTSRDFARLQVRQGRRSVYLGSISLPMLLHGCLNTLLIICVVRQVSPPHVVPCCQVMCPQRASAAVWVQLWSCLAALQLMQHRRVQVPCCLQLIIPAA